MEIQRPTEFSVPEFQRWASDIMDYIYGFYPDEAKTETEKMYLLSKELLLAFQYGKDNGWWLDLEEEEND